MNINTLTDKQLKRIRCSDTPDSFFYLSTNLKARTSRSLVGSLVRSHLVPEKIF